MIHTHYRLCVLRESMHSVQPWHSLITESRDVKVEAHAFADCDNSSFSRIQLPHTHIPSGRVAKINIPWPWPWPWHTERIQCHLRWTLSWSSQVRSKLIQSFLMLGNTESCLNKDRNKNGCDVKFIGLWICLANSSANSFSLTPSSLRHCDIESTVQFWYSVYHRTLFTAETCRAFKQANMFSLTVDRRHWWRCGLVALVTFCPKWHFFLWIYLFTLSQDFGKIFVCSSIN